MNEWAINSLNVNSGSLDEVFFKLGGEDVENYHNSNNNTNQQQEQQQLQEESLVYSNDNKKHSSHDSNKNGIASSNNHHSTNGSSHSEKVLQQSDYIIPQHNILQQSYIPLSPTDNQSEDPHLTNATTNDTTNNNHSHAIINMNSSFNTTNNDNGIANTNASAPSSLMLPVNIKSVSTNSWLYFSQQTYAIILRKLCYARRDQYLVYTVVPITAMSLLAGILYNLLLLPPDFDPSRFNLTNTNNMTYNTIPSAVSATSRYMNVNVMQHSISSSSRLNNSSTSSSSDTLVEINVINIMTFLWQILIFLNKLLVDGTDNILRKYVTTTNSDNTNNLFNNTTTPGLISTTSLLHSINIIYLSYTNANTNTTDPSRRHHTYIGNYTADDSQNNINKLPIDFISNVMTIFFYYLMFLGRYSSRIHIDRFIILLIKFLFVHTDI